MKTGIIIPCYNEEKRLDVSAFLTFVQNHDTYHLCFVNDGSIDETIKVLRSMQKQVENQISVLNVKRNVGKASAVRAGARYFYNRKDVDYIGFMDADLSTDFNDFKKLVATMDKNEALSMVFGSRRKGECEVKRTGFRNLFSKTIKWIVFLILRLPIEDTQCGAKLFRRSSISIAYSKPFFTRWLFDVEIFIRLKKQFGTAEIMNKLYEQPLERWVHMEDSKLGLRDALKIPYMLLCIWFLYTVIQFSNTTNEVNEFRTFDEVIRIQVIDSINQSAA